MTDSFELRRAQDELAQLREAVSVIADQLANQNRRQLIHALARADGQFWLWGADHSLEQLGEAMYGSQADEVTKLLTRYHDDLRYALGSECNCGTTKPVRKLNGVLCGRCRTVLEVSDDDRD